MASQLGSNNSLSTPHEYDLGTALAPGKHQLTIRVDNGLVVDVGVNSHCVTDHTQGNWNGIVGDISLRATPPVWIEDVQVYPDCSNNEVRVVARIGNATGQAGAGELSVQYEQCDQPKTRRGIAAQAAEAARSNGRRDRWRRSEFEMPLARRQAEPVG